MAHAHSTINHDQSEPNIKNIVWGILISTFVFIASIAIGMLIYKGGSSEEMNQKENVGPSEALQELRSMETEHLNNYKWIDKEKGAVQLPISEAINKTVQAYKN